MNDRRVEPTTRVPSRVWSRGPAVALALALATVAGPAAAQQPAASTATFRATNPLDLARDEVVSVPWDRVAAALSGAAQGRVRVLEAASGRELPSQVMDLDADGVPEELLFLAGFRPGETVELRVEAAAPASFPPRVNIYYDSARDDVAWENDRIAFRTYGRGLWKIQDLVSSGTDVMVKRVAHMVIEGWYASGDYHTDHGEGADFFSVGETLGAGGIAVLEDGGLDRAANFVAHRVLADGPLRGVFELDYEPRDVDGRTVTETRRITIDAGSNLFLQSTTFDASGPGPEEPIEYAIGTVRREGLIASWDPDAAWPWLATWQPVVELGGHGDLGIAVMLPPRAGASPTLDVRDVEGHAVVVGHAAPGDPVVHYAGAGWTAAPGFDSVEDWWAYLERVAERLVAPIRLSAGTDAGAPSR